MRLSSTPCPTTNGQSRIVLQMSDSNPGRGSVGLGWLLVWLLTQIICSAAMLFLFTLGLILIEFLVYPLALGIGALLAGLTATFAANGLVRDGRQTLVNPVVARCEMAAVIFSILLIAASGMGLLQVRLIFVIVVAAVAMTAIAVYFAGQYRGLPIPDPRKNRRVAIWLFIALAAVPVVIFLASLLGWAGA